VIKETIQDVKEEHTKHTESLPKHQNQKQMETLKIKDFLSQIKNRVEGHSNRLVQVEDRISGLEDKVYMIEKDR
jgi:hypothetical protein